MPGKYRIMFVCTGNTCRSPMAEGALKKLLEKDGVNNVEVVSSGTGAVFGFPATDYAIEAAKIWDANISRHKSQPVTRELIERMDLVLCMSPAHCEEVKRLSEFSRDKIYLLRNYPKKGCQGEGIDDPIGGTLDIYNRAFLEIGEELGRILPFIKEAAAKKAKESD